MSITAKIRYKLARIICPEMAQEIVDLKTRLNDMAIDFHHEYESSYAAGFSKGINSK
jgi:hypothetical protein